MREIKFRAWDNSIKEMGEVFSIEFDIGRIGMTYTDSTGCNIIHYQDWERVQLREFTGLQDKHGKDIYEGDIVIYTEFETIISEEGTDHNEIPQYGVIVWDKSYARFVIKDSCEPYDCMDDDEHLEVVGNIYENPELLEERK